MTTGRTESGGEHGSRQKMEADKAADPFRFQRTLWFARIGLFAAVCGAGYLAAVSLTGGGIAGCGPESGCNRVLSSRWAYWLGIPVSIPAFASYVTLLVLTSLVDRRRSALVQRRSWKAVVCLSIIILGAAFWFVLVQMLVVRTWCKFCLGTHLSAAAAAAALLSRTMARAEAGQQPDLGGLKLRNWTTSVLGAGLGLVVLVMGQLVVKKRLYAVSLLAGHAASGSSQISLHNGEFKLYPRELPVLGSTAATNFIVSLFDFTCSHCRALHPLLKEAQEKYQRQLGIIALPVPLDAVCNSLILITAPENKDACEYARIALAVWHARPEAFAELDEWIFASVVPPPIEKVRAKAEALVGKPALEKALRSSWVDRQLRMDVSLYQANARAVGDGRLPQLVIGDVITHGAIDSQGDVLRLIEQHLHLKTDVQQGKSAQAGGLR